MTVRLYYNAVDRRAQASNEWHAEWISKRGGFVNGMVASHLLRHSGTINRHSLNGALLS